VSIGDNGWLKLENSLLKKVMLMLDTGYSMLDACWCE